VAQSRNAQHEGHTVERALPIEISGSLTEIHTFNLLSPKALPTASSPKMRATRFSFLLADVTNPPIFSTLA